MSIQLTGRNYEFSSEDLAATVKAKDWNEAKSSTLGLWEQFKHYFGFSDKGKAIQELFGELNQADISSQASSTRTPAAEAARTADAQLARFVKLKSLCLPEHQDKFIVTTGSTNKGESWHYSLIIDRHALAGGTIPRAGTDPDILKRFGEESGLVYILPNVFDTESRKAPVSSEVPAREVSAALAMPDPAQQLDGTPPSVAAGEVPAEEVPAAPAMDIPDAPAMDIPDAPPLDIPARRAGDASNMPAQQRSSAEARRAVPGAVDAASLQTQRSALKPAGDRQLAPAPQQSQNLMEVLGKGLQEKFKNMNKA